MVVVAHRAHIVLTELGIQFQEEIVDLEVPRTPEYLKINPLGQVPTLIYNGEMIQQSAIIAQIAFFVDSWFSKVQPHYFKTLLGKTEKETEDGVTEYIAALVNEVEPLLANTGPFFGGSEKITPAEVLTGPFRLEQDALNFSRWAREVVKHPSVISIFNEESIVEATKKW
ncbi:hypothetical protein BGZ63DRAFT_417979 [Mariannaea sp. PMI_226]|nr:hypothetical protein BGZ63DRAFT_417979 [Mariannaea sp. PMI_226]